MTRRRPPVVPATLADVAERAGVSRQTVSNAINNPRLLRPATLARVEAAIAELGYAPNRAARNLRTRSSRLVGMRQRPAREGTADALMDRFVHALVEHCREVGYHVLLFAGDDADPVGGYAELVGTTTVDAFVLSESFLGHPEADWLRRRGVPFVAFGRPWDGPHRPSQPSQTGGAGHPWVDVDGAAGVALATRHLQEHGHRRIVWLGWHKESEIGEDRRSGWVSAMHELNTSTRGLAARVEDSVGSGREGAAMLLDGAAPTAIVCASDTLALGAVHTLLERGLRPGLDVSVVGFDDSQAAQLLPGGLTSVRQPLEEVAREVVADLEALLARPAEVRSPRLLEPTLSVRGSSGPCSTG